MSRDVGTLQQVAWYALSCVKLGSFAFCCADIIVVILNHWSVGLRKKPKSCQLFWVGLFFVQERARVCHNRARAGQAVQVKYMEEMMKSLVVLIILIILIFRELMRGISCVEDFIGNCSSIEERHVFQVLFFLKQHDETRHIFLESLYYCTTVSLYMMTIPDCRDLS